MGDSGLLHLCKLKVVYINFIYDSPTFSQQICTFPLKCHHGERAKKVWLQLSTFPLLTPHILPPHLVPYFFNAGLAAPCFIRLLIFSCCLEMLPWRMSLMSSRRFMSSDTASSATTSSTLLSTCEQMFFIFFQPMFSTLHR